MLSEEGLCAWLVDDQDLVGGEVRVQSVNESLGVCRASLTSNDDLYRIQ